MVGRVSTFAGKYTPQFVEAIMETVPRFVAMKRACLAECPQWTSKQHDEVLAAKPDLSAEKSDAELLKVIDRVHRNLGHPPVHDMVRILKHAQASERAVKLAHQHKCSFVKPRSSLMCHCQQSLPGLVSSIKPLEWM